MLVSVTLISGSDLPSPDIFGKSIYTFYIGQNDFTSNLASAGISGVQHYLPQVVAQIAATVKVSALFGLRTFFLFFPLSTRIIINLSKLNMTDKHRYILKNKNQTGAYRKIELFQSIKSCVGGLLINVYMMPCSKMICKRVQIKMRPWKGPYLELRN